MKGKANVIEILNDALTAELTAINQYFLHYKMRENWGYHRLAKNAREESIDEMKHAEKLMDRILFLDGVPNVQRYNKIAVGNTVREQFQNELAAELEAREMYNRGAALCREEGDNGSKAIFEELLEDEEGHIDWLEAQLGLMDELGEANYLAQQLGESDEG